jgi:DNA-binding transcriptional ArsR family regulator
MNEEQEDLIFGALADRTRRRMVDLLAQKACTTGELAAAFPQVSRFAVMKHLTVLESAGLLLITREGRSRWNRLNPVPLREVMRRWMSRHEEQLADQLLAIRDAAEGGSAGGEPPGAAGLG